MNRKSGHIKFMTVRNLWVWQSNRGRYADMETS